MTSPLCPRGRPCSSCLPRPPPYRNPAHRTPSLCRRGPPSGRTPIATLRVRHRHQEERKDTHSRHLLFLLLPMLGLGLPPRPLLRYLLLAPHPGPFAIYQPPPPICALVPLRLTPLPAALRPEVRAQPLCRGGLRSFSQGPDKLQPRGIRKPLPTPGDGGKREALPTLRKEDRVLPQATPEGCRGGLQPLLQGEVLRQPRSPRSRPTRSWCTRTIRRHRQRLRSSWDHL